MSPELLEELVECRTPLVEEEEVEAHSLEVVEVAVGLPFLVLEEEGEEEEEQGHQGEEEEEVEEGVERGHLGEEEEAVVVERGHWGGEEEEVVGVERGHQEEEEVVEEVALTLLVRVEEEVAEEVVPLFVPVKHEEVLLLLEAEVVVAVVEVEAVADMNTGSRPGRVEAAGSR